MGPYWLNGYCWGRQFLSMIYVCCFLLNVSHGTRKCCLCSGVLSFFAASMVFLRGIKCAMKILIAVDSFDVGYKFPRNFPIRCNEVQEHKDNRNCALSIVECSTIIDINNWRCSPCICYAFKGWYRATQMWLPCCPAAGKFPRQNSCIVSSLVSSAMSRLSQNTVCIHCVSFTYLLFLSLDTLLSN